MLLIEKGTCTAVEKGFLHLEQKDKALLMFLGYRKQTLII